MLSHNPVGDLAREAVPAPGIPLRECGTRQSGTAIRTIVVGQRESAQNPGPDKSTNGYGTPSGGAGVVLAPGPFRSGERTHTQRTGNAEHSRPLPVEPHDPGNLGELRG